VLGGSWSWVSVILNRQCARWEHTVGNDKGPTDGGVMERKTRSPSSSGCRTIDDHLQGREKDTKDRSRSRQRLCKVERTGGSEGGGGGNCAILHATHLLLKGNICRHSRALRRHAKDFKGALLEDLWGGKGGGRAEKVMRSVSYKGSCFRKRKSRPAIRKGLRNENPTTRCRGGRRKKSIERR